MAKKVPFAWYVIDLAQGGLMVSETYRSADAAYADCRARNEAGKTTRYSVKEMK